ncbi:MAG: hypothetical protein HZB33_09060 [Nitrospirae bacterium]|nr:hypothetical protein [Nitrospirota bacterium]
MKKRFIIISLFLLLFSNVAMADLYVSTTGNDVNDCTSSVTPCLTINRAINVATGSEIVIKIAAGTYTGASNQVSLSGPPLSYGTKISFVGTFNPTTGEPTTIIDMEGSSAGSSAFNLRNGFQVYIQDIAIKNVVTNGIICSDNVNLFVYNAWIRFGATAGDKTGIINSSHGHTYSKKTNIDCGRTTNDDRNLIGNQGTYASVIHAGYSTTPSIDNKLKGTHAGSANSIALTTSGLEPGRYVGARLENTNTTKKATCQIAAQAADTVTCGLAGGWKVGDQFKISISGTHTGFVDPTVLTSSVSLGANNLAGYTVENLTTHKSCSITATTETTVTCDSLEQGWKNGDKFEISTTGTHTGSDSLTQLTSPVSFGSNIFVDYLLENLTTFKNCLIADNTSTTVVCGLEGVSDNKTYRWNPGDEYIIRDGSDNYANCKTGLYFSENTTGHTDYSFFTNNNPYGVSVGYESRTNLVGNTFKYNNRGVYAWHNSTVFDSGYGIEPGSADWPNYWSAVNYGFDNTYDIELKTGSTLGAPNSAADLTALSTPIEIDTDCSSALSAGWGCVDTDDSYEQYPGSLAASSLTVTNPVQATGIFETITNADKSSYFTFRRARISASTGLKDAVKANDPLGTIAFAGWTGGLYPTAAAIQAYAAEDFTASNYPTYIRFSTTNGNQFKEHVRLAKNGGLGVGQTIPEYRLDVKSSLYLDGITFTGTGLNDATFGGTSTAAEPAWYYVRVDGNNGTSDTFAWAKCTSSCTSGCETETGGVPITGLTQNLKDAITVKYLATTGHTINAKTCIKTTSLPPFRVRARDGKELVTVNESGVSKLVVAPTNQTPPATCDKGTITWNESGIYVCTDTNTWRYTEFKQ